MAPEAWRIAGANAQRGAGAMSAGVQQRWIVLGADGRHVSLGRSEPSDAEVASASDALAAQGLSGWLARMQGEYYSRGKVMLEPLQRIGAEHEADWQAALAAFHAARQRATH
jgi:hypothetical protein